jgi:hypothetical protein
MRPFGKYLVGICVIWEKCHHANEKLPVTNTPQTITIKQVGCAEGAKPCPDPVYPLQVGKDFYIQATSDSGATVKQKVMVGNVSPKEGQGTQKYHLDGPGSVVIEATADAGGNYAAVTPVEILLTAAGGGGDSSDASCKGLLAASATTQQTIDPAGIISLIGSPVPYVLAAQGKDKIFIYSTRLPDGRAEEIQLLKELFASIESLAGQFASNLGVTAAGKPFQVELEIRHAAALGDPAARISALNYSQFTVQDIGADRVRVTSAAQPDCTLWTSFLTAIRQLEWQPVPEPFEKQLFYLNATDAATAFNSLGSSSNSGGSSGSPAASTPAPSPTPSSSGGGSAANSASSNATIAVTQPPGSFVDIKSDTTPCVIAGLTMSNSSACGSGSGAPASSSASSPGSSSSGGGSTASAAKPQPPAMAAMGVAAGAGEQSFSDLLVFSDATPGDDAQIMERKRILAALDLPRPEMIINAWVMQNSTANPTAMGEFNSVIKNLVTDYNDALGKVVLSGWGVLELETRKSGYFDEDFYHYIADHYIADTHSSTKPSGTQPAAQSFLDTSSASWADTDEIRTNQFGICPLNRYCLGYNGLFQPLKPRLTDFLLTLIAAKDPKTQMTNAIAEVEKNGGVTNPISTLNECDKRSKETNNREFKNRCRAVWANLGLDRSFTPSNCAVTDFKAILGSLSHGSGRPGISLACLKELADIQLDSIAGLLRAAIADFLFNYKISSQYPHEFTPYDLSQSADTLNSALTPIIDAFNRDIVAFQTFMRADIQYQVERLNSAIDQRCCAKRLFGLDKPSFFNDGLITVRTISGQPTTVNTTSQSFLDASSAPTLANLANNIASPGSGSSTGTSPIAGVLGSKQPSASLVTGVLNSYQTAYAQIGRQLNLIATPRSLSTASSAEINVTLNADESSGGPAYSGGPQGASNPNTSRVAQHDTVTRVRVESVKLFELSSFSAVVERSRSRFPLLPPFVEIPYIGTLVGIPIPAAKEYHSSTAVLSAMVVPTAADIAYGLRFVFDQVLDVRDSSTTSCSIIAGSAGSQVKSTCHFRKAVSLADLNQSPVRNFHKAMLNCFASGMQTPYTSFGSLINPPHGACKDLTFDRVPNY